MNLEQILEQVPELRGAARMTPLTKGFSSDRKYIVYDAADRPVYVVRTAEIGKEGAKRREFEVVGRAAAAGVRTPAPVAFFTLTEQQTCGMVLEHAGGTDAAEALPYAAGVEAGRELRLLHTIGAPAEMQPWHRLREAKHRRQWQAYRECGVKLPAEEAVEAFIETHLPCMEGRPSGLQHDDFHPSNLLIAGGRYAAVIDFNRYDWGDPYHDFLKIAYFSREVSVSFSTGQIHGYFGGRAPDLFWTLYALYTAMILGGTITWTLQVVPEQLPSMMDRIRVVLEDHRNFESMVPVWYKE
ncbi:Aminoglycoside phosphotransferase [Paenibacillus mucilaginosus 3016]|uniref:Aminoglycoside phosphotransferase n=1 Tax=Paenibacillus mucilaginosus 3016 TaxID=1116391 RepID=H6NKN3_9BACL|nr:aminoglycoside phosphotransferase family protein [Paenibacillus mucilaginosus]AFC33170.1 Aminoglycoside phosphotransferase [Paenibacillus mucilaginosus 3016]WFA21600.1 aminoglycoside phosphotransferase family protein [Paenibacillus mucilaginosus]